MKRPALMGRERRSWRALPFVVLFAALFALICFEFVFAARFVPVYVDGESMEPTLMDGDWLYADRYRTPQRGDIVIVDVSDEEDGGGRPLFAGIEVIIKRLIAVEGDTLRYLDGSLYLRYAGTDEFVRLEDPNANGDCGFFPEITLKEGEIFLLGDNRRTSHDSSEAGALHMENVIGVVPDWAVRCKSAITSWEGFRSRFSKN